MNGKDILGLACAAATASLWIAIGCSGPDDDSGPDPAEETVAAEEYEAPADPLREQFEAEWSGLDQQTREAYCWALESMTPEELAGFSSDLTGQDPADWELVTQMINEECTGE